MKNIIHQSSISDLGYHFIDESCIPEGKDEYYLRNQQNRSGIQYRQLTAFEIEILVRNHNSSDNWNHILVADDFNPELVKNCQFFGLVRIGRLENICLGFSDLTLPVGLYNSTIISCDFGDNVVVNNVNYLSHYIIGNEVMLVNVKEMITTPHSKFGNGIVKDNEDESVRIWLEIGNENGGRKVMPFNGMLPGDAWLWSKYRDDTVLLERFRKFTEDEFKTAPGYYGKIGDRTVIKDTGIIKDVWIGIDAYIKGANKLKNLTINSGEEGRSQIGESCELVNGIIGYGCRIFYGVKAVRFILASHSQLKYGARLINSYLGNNATISCCEVLNSLIFPAHEQHHNNSFLCAAVIMGQSNIPAGATIGSNHNSRGADGEIIAERGFWPALCVNFKHNSLFPVFTMVARGNYPYELHIPIPFSLVSHNEKYDRIEIMVGYWFQYNMYALTRNAWKYGDRDQRIEKQQLIEYDYLAPDSVNEMFEAMALIEKTVGNAYAKAFPEKVDKSIKTAEIGRKLLWSQDPILETLSLALEGVEHSKRPVVLTKAVAGYHAFRKMITYYATNLITGYLLEDTQCTIDQKLEKLNNIPAAKRNRWLNIGGQLMPEKEVTGLREKVRQGEIDSWKELHLYYETLGKAYPLQKLEHALASLRELDVLETPFTRANLPELFRLQLQTQQEIVKAIKESRQKDYSSPFRKMVYDNPAEMEAVIGKPEDNGFIREQEKELKQRENAIGKLQAGLS